MMSGKVKKKLYCKGKLVTEKVYNHRLRSREAASKLNALRSQPDFAKLVVLPNPQTVTKTLLEPIDTDGRYIINLKHMAKMLNCDSCSNVLSLENIVSERQIGLASEFVIQCKNCKVLKKVSTDKQHNSAKGDIAFDVNTKAIVATLNSGMGLMHLNKFLSAMNIQKLSWHLFNSHEKEVGCAVEEMAQDSCKEATVEERNLTIKICDEVKRLL